MFQLLKRGIPAWLDIKDLRPGEFWNRDLEAALDAASCVVLLVSPESMKSPNVRAEWERALRQRKRIVLALFRGTKLPAELAGCEIVDFRGAFTRALNRLIERLAGKSSARTPARFPFLLPPWILAISLLLFFPLMSYFLLADWRMHTAFEWVLLPVAVLLFGWALFFSFLRRRMGMTHLLVCFAFCAAWTCYPLMLYAVKGQAALAGYAQPMARVIAQQDIRILLLSVLPLVGLAILLVIQPEDLLRWTPTGKAWGWFRARRIPKIPVLEGSSALRSLGRFYLLHDPLDEPAAAQLRRELTHPGAEETTAQLSGGTAVLLLTNRTRSQWLAHNARQVQSRMLTVVGARIALPAELDWLWQREWIDFRHWDLNRLDRKSGLLRVPETVSATRFPSSVRLAHHLLCSTLALSLLLVGLADPAFGENPDSPDLTPQNIAAVVVMALWIWYISLSRKLLRRTVSERAFYHFWPIGLAAVALLAVWSFGEAIVTRHVNPLRSLPVAAFLIAWPILFLRNRPKLAFWFPATQVSTLKHAPSLACKRDWQTLAWVCVYLGVWGILLGLYAS